MATRRSTPGISDAEDLVTVICEAVRVGCLTGVREVFDHQGGVPARATPRTPRTVRIVLLDETTFVINAYTISPPVTHYVAPSSTSAATATRRPRTTPTPVPGVIYLNQTRLISTVEDLYTELGDSVRSGCLKGVSEFLDHQGGVPARATPRNLRTVRLVLNNRATIVVSTYSIAPPVRHYVSPAPPAGRSGRRSGQRSRR